MITGLHSRKKTHTHDDETDLEMSRSTLSASGDEGERKTHGRVSFLRRFIRSEVGCAIEIVTGFFAFGILLGYIILHNHHNKVRRFEWRPDGMKLDLFFINSFISYCRKAIRLMFWSPIDSNKCFILFKIHR